MHPFPRLTVPLLTLLAAALAGCDQSEAESPDRLAPEPIGQTAAAPPQDAPAKTAAGAAEEAAPEGLPVVDLAALQAIVAEADAADQVLVIDFWATWCQPCIAMFPELHEGLHEMGPAVRPVTVTFDSPGTYEQNAITFLREHDALEDAYLVTPEGDAQLALTKGFTDKWNNLAVPAILIFDRDGQLAAEFYEGPAAPILQRVRELIGSQQ